MDYLLSIIVPTKNRYIYLKSILKTFTRMDNGKVELIIQDNSENNEEILMHLDSNNSNNIKYFHYKEHLPVSENFNYGVLNSSGKYVCMLGDDDGVSSKIVDIVKYMDINDIESAIFNKASYVWPDMEFRMHKIPSLRVPRSTGKVSFINVDKELKKCIKKGATSLMKLPEIYHGVLRRSTLEEIFLKCSTYFPGPSPDMAFAIASSLVVKTHVYIDAPYTFSGQAFNSAAGKGARNEHKGRLKEIKWLPSDIEEKWESKIPLIWTGSTIYAESAHKALRAMGREELIKEFNYSYQYAWLWCFNPEYKGLLKQLRKRNILSKIKFSLYVIKIFLLRLRKFIENIIKFKMHYSKDYFIKDVENSYDASKLIDDFIHNTK